MKSEAPDTKERILQAALELFARRGYDAVSVSDIAGSLSLTKGALYRHYESKRDIFESILSRMEREDRERARKNGVPEEPFEKSPEVYRRTGLAELGRYSAAQLDYWTREPFPAAFRRLLTIEQYRDGELAALYGQYFVTGPLEYVERLLGSREEALEFYAPMFALYSLYDLTEDKNEAAARLRRHLERFTERRKGEMKDGISQEQSL